MPPQRPDPATIQTRRLAALGALLATFFLVVGIVVSSGGDSNDERGSAQGTTPSKKAARSTPKGPALPAKVPANAPGAHRALGEPVPILMYHVINKAPADAPFPDLYVSGADFAGQMRALRARGYNGVTLGQVWDAWKGKGLLPRKPVVISFDDGYHGIYARALPVLRGLRWPGTLNLELRVLDQPEEGGLSRREVRGLIAAGWEVDSHTVDHPDLTTVDPAQLQREVQGSRDDLKREFGVTARFFCYPAGRFDDDVVAAVRQAGYLAATTVEYGLAKPGKPYELPRVRINGGDRVDGLLRKMDALAGGDESAPDNVGEVPAAQGD